MRCYGDKPESFLAKVPRGLLPVIELDGQVMTESAEIMKVLEYEFRDVPLLPPETDRIRYWSLALASPRTSLTFCSHCFISRGRSCDTQVAYINSVQESRRSSWLGKAALLCMDGLADI